MDGKKKQAEHQEYRDDYRDEYRDDQQYPSELEVPEEMEAWALDDMSDLVPTIFD